MLVTDVGLPDGSGLDLLREVRDRCPGPVSGITMSGYRSRGDLDGSCRAGFDAHLTKPVEFDDLLASIRRICPASRDRAAGVAGNRPRG
nr:response regulator [Tautonia plasticadhaerens]